MRIFVTSNPFRTAEAKELEKQAIAALAKMFSLSFPVILSRSGGVVRSIDGKMSQRSLIAIQLKLPQPTQDAARLVPADRSVSDLPVWINCNNPKRAEYY
jgi:hypothetical protein